VDCPQLNEMVYVADAGFVCRGPQVNSGDLMKLGDSNSFNAIIEI
jgi:hypothetical protein